MWTVTINWHLLLGYLVFVVVSAIVNAIVDDALGIKDRLKDLSQWRKSLHETMYVLYGMLVYIWFLKPLLQWLNL